jgi:O-antigen ligase
LLFLIAGFVGVLYSSFRSTVFNTLGVTLAAGIRDLKFKVLLLVPFLALLLFGLSVLNSEVIHLPKQVQRSLSFLPGKWDADMKQDAVASNDFRTQTWSVWTREYFPLHPWLGRGFGFRSQWAERSIYKPTATDYRQTVEVGDIHNGFLASLDAFGIIGTAAFVIWNLRLLARTLQIPFRKDDQAGIALRFIALYLAVSIITYWVGAQNIGAFLPQEFALAGVFLRLQEAEHPPKATRSSSKQEDSVTRSLAVA